ncbi:MAG TPA: hypothetical protein VFB54_19585 [Burkholderiales bacterium]|nr:hypothetical protein [Burkholderiales bacterium]
MEVPPRAGRVSLNYAGHRYAASYEMTAGVLTVRSPYGCAEVPLSHPELATASAARTLLRQIVVRNDARNRQAQR